MTHKHKEAYNSLPVLSGCEQPTSLDVIHFNCFVCRPGTESLQLLVSPTFLLKCLLNIPIWKIIIDATQTNNTRHLKVFLYNLRVFALRHVHDCLIGNMPGLQENGKG